MTLQKDRQMDGRFQQFGFRGYGQLPYLGQIGLSNKSFK